MNLIVRGDGRLDKGKGKRRRENGEKRWDEVKEGGKDADGRREKGKERGKEEER